MDDNMISTVINEQLGVIDRGCNTLSEVTQTAAQLKQSVQLLVSKNDDLKRENQVLRTGCESLNEVKRENQLLRQELDSIREMESQIHVINGLKREIELLKQNMSSLNEENRILVSERESMQTELESIREEKEMMRKEVRELRHENDILHQKESFMVDFAKNVLQTNVNGLVNSLPEFSHQMVLNERNVNSMTAIGSSTQMSGMRLTSKEDLTYHNTRDNSNQNSKETTSDDTTYYTANTSNQSSIACNGVNGVRPKVKSIQNGVNGDQQNQVSSTVVDVLNTSMTTRTESSNSYTLDERNNLKLKLVKVRSGQMAIQVAIAYIVSPTDFWLHLNRQQVHNYLHAIQVEQLKLISEGNSKLTSADVELGMFCAAIYSVDEYWYRAQVIRITYENSVEKDSIKTVKVLFVDYGNCEELPLQKIMKLSKELTSRRQAVHCILQGFGLENYKWPKKSIDEFRDMVENKKLSASFQKPIKLNERLDSVIYPTDLVVVCDNGVSENVVNFIPIPEISDAIDCDNDLMHEFTDERAESAETAATQVCNDKLVIKPHITSNKSSKTNGFIEINPKITELKTQSNQNCATNGIQHNCVQRVTKSVPKSMPLSGISDIFIISPPIVPDNKEGLIVNASHLVDPFHFYVHINDTQVGTAHLENLEDRLNSYYPNYVPSGETRVPKVTVGSFWSCKFTEDQQWYRCRVVKLSERKVFVNYVDYGNDEWVDIEELLPLTREFANLPALAVKCMLSNVSPKGTNKWSDVSIKHFGDLIADSPLTAFVAQKPSKFDFESALEVFLWTIEKRTIGSTGKEVLINADLVVNEYATTDMSEWVEEAERALREKTPPEVMSELIPKLNNNNTKYVAVNGVNGHNCSTGAQNSDKKIKILPELLEDDSDDEWDPMKDDANCDINNYNVMPDNLGIASVGYTIPNKRSCKFYGTSGGCRLDQYCQFLHIQPDKRFALDDAEDEPYQDIADRELDVDSCVLFKITSILSPFSFYGVLPFGESTTPPDIESEYKELDELSKVLKDKYSKINSKENPNIFPGIGSLVAYKEEENGNYYRGRVIGADDDENRCTIFNIDLGVNVTARRVVVFKLDRYFCQFPALAIHCSLSGIEPIKCNPNEPIWSEEAIDAFGSWTLDRTLLAQIKFGRTEDKLYVELIDKVGDEEVLISDKLVHFKFAQTVQQRLSRKASVEDFYSSDVSD